MISVDDVTKTFGKRIALDRVSLKVQRGEMVGLLGPNGAGKTTLMRVITGFIPPTAGTVTVSDIDVFEHPDEVKQRIGYLPEQPPLYLEMTARECLAFIGEVHGLRGATLMKAIDRVAEACGITEALPRLTGNLSKGFRQRVGLAQALIHDPDVLVLDEPTVGLDPRQIIEIRKLIKKLGQDRTVIISSHILHEIRQMTGRIAILHEGRLMAIDTIEALSERLKGGRKVVLRLARPEQIERAGLDSLNGVRVISRKPGGEFELLITGGDHVLESLSRAVVDAGAGLLALADAGFSLEDIFLDVVSGANGS